jgi:allantoicase
MTGEYFLCSQRISREDTIHRCTIKLGTTGIITGFDIDTTHFIGIPELSLDIGLELDDIAT